MFESNTATCGGSVVAGAIHLMGYKLPNGGE